VIITAQPGTLSFPRAAQRAEPAVRADGLSYTLDGRMVLADIDLDIPAGAGVALMGANGAGKSTLLRVLAGLIAPTAGRLCLFGSDSARSRSDVRARVGLVGHQPMLYRDLTALENLEFFGKLYRVAAPRARGMALLDELGMAARAHDPVRSLSRGLVQRVAVARALVHGPGLLLADEPFSGLDGGSAAALEALLARLVAEGTTVVTATHDLGQAPRIAERIVVLRKGRIEIDSRAREADGAEVAAAIGGGA